MLHEKEVSFLVDQLTTLRSALKVAERECDDVKRELDKEVLLERHSLHEVSKWKYNIAEMCNNHWILSFSTNQLNATLAILVKTSFDGESPHSLPIELFKLSSITFKHNSYLCMRCTVITFVIIVTTVCVHKCQLALWKLLHYSQYNSYELSCANLFILWFPLCITDRLRYSLMHIVSVAVAPAHIHWPPAIALEPFPCTASGFWWHKKLPKEISRSRLKNS